MDDVLHPNFKDDAHKVNELIRNIRVAMLTSISEDGKMHSRPMLTQNIEFDGDLWFFAKDTAKVLDEITWNRQVHINYVSPDGSRYVSIAGTGEIIRELSKEKELWNQSYQDWFPNGLSQDDLCLIRVIVDEVEFWDTHGTQTLKLNKERLKDYIDHGKIQLAG